MNIKNILLGVLLLTLTSSFIKMQFTIPSSVIQSRAKNLNQIIFKIYAVLGNEVAILLNKEKPTGEDEVELYVNELTSGVYFYQLRVYPEVGGVGN